MPKVDTCFLPLQATQVPHNSNQSSFFKSYNSYLNLDILAYSPSICNKSFLKAEVINRFRYTFSSHICVEPKRHFGRQSLNADLRQQSSWKERFPNVTFLKQNLPQSNNRVANFATLAVQVTKERRGKKSASNTRQCNIISIFSWKPCIQVYLLNALKCEIQNGQPLQNSWDRKRYGPKV